MRTCENCGCRVYSLGCVNCDEEAYISEQEGFTNEQETRPPRCSGCGSRGCDNPNCGSLENADV